MVPLLIYSSEYRKVTFGISIEIAENRAICSEIAGSCIFHGFPRLGTTVVGSLACNGSKRGSLIFFEVFGPKHCCVEVFVSESSIAERMLRVDSLSNGAPQFEGTTIVRMFSFGSLCSRYLVDPASSHMLVSMIKPCMSKHKPNMVKPRMAHYNSHSLLDLRVLLGYLL